MSTITNIDLPTDLQSNLKMILAENSRLATEIDFNQIADIIPFIQNADRIFVVGAGRTGLALKAAAMRLMHLGFTVFVAGETTTPAIRDNDLLIAGSRLGNHGHYCKGRRKSRFSWSKGDQHFHLRDISSGKIIGSCCHTAGSAKTRSWRRYFKTIRRKPF
jgi:hypothetical protein